ncbi:MAG: C39 family peptidase [Anaerolineales bacterium]
MAEQTIDSHGPIAAPEGNPWLMRFVWLVGGFNIGFVVPGVVLFLLLPALMPGLAPRRTAEAVAETRTQLAYVVVTNIPSPTPTLLPASPTPTALPPSPSPTPEATAQPTLEVAATDVLPSETALPSATPIPATATPLPAPTQFRLEGVSFHQQGWNNCGPANLAMGLSYFGWEGDQNDTARALKPNDEDKNVSPDQMVSYVNEQTNLRALYRVAGTDEMLRWLVANEFLVIVESGYQPPGDAWYGHYFTVGGYDDERGVFQFYDSYLGRPSRPITEIAYDSFDDDWQAFNRLYIIIYPPAREPELQAFLGRDWNEAANWRHALERAQAEAAEQPDNAFAWFNVGTARTMLGDYANAARSFDQAFSIGLPRRMLWYQFGPYEAFFQASRLDDVIALANTTISTTPYVEEAYYYLGQVYEVRGDREAAEEQYSLALRYNENFRAAQVALQRVVG